MYCKSCGMYIVALVKQGHMYDVNPSIFSYLLLSVCLLLKRSSSHNRNSGGINLQI